MGKKIFEAVISSSKSKPFILELKDYFDRNDSISFADLAIMAYTYGIEVVDYETFYDELPELWKKGQIPHGKIKIFGLANPLTKKPRLVVTIDEINKNQFPLIAIIVSHEFVHSGQMDRLKPGVIYVPPTTVYDAKKYYSDYQEVMAWSKTIVDEIMNNYQPESFEQAMEYLPKGNYYKKIKKEFQDEPRTWNKYLKNIYNYFKMEFNPEEKKENDLLELRKKIKKILNEEEKIKINHAYFQKVLDISRTSLKNRNFIQNVINTIRKNGGMGTKRQYEVLKKFETGDNTPYSPKN